MFLSPMFTMYANIKVHLLDRTSFPTYFGSTLDLIIQLIGVIFCPTLCA